MSSFEPQKFLSRELALVIQDRSELAARFNRNAERPWLACQICGGAVMLVRTQQRHFHFRHHPDEEGKRDCPISTRGAFSADQINRMKYNAAKESSAHLRLKGIIRDSLLADSECSDPEVEKVWRSMPTAERAKWRKPDVQVERAGQRLAFEVQLSTRLPLPQDGFLGHRQQYLSAQIHCSYSGTEEWATYFSIGIATDVQKAPLVEEICEAGAPLNSKYFLNSETLELWINGQLAGLAVTV